MPTILPGEMPSSFPVMASCSNPHGPLLGWEWENGFDEKGKPQRMTDVNGKGNPVMTRH